MKKALSLLLASLFVLTALASCAVSPDVAVSSSVEDTYAAKLPEGSLVVCGDNAASYGVDLSDFSDDGYILRVENGSASLFAPTAKGLDRGVRYYTKNYTGGDLTKIYGEGHRVKKLTIAGTDISEFAIVYPSSTPYGVFEESLLYTAETFSSEIELATGVKIPYFADKAEGYDHTINLVVDMDRGLKEAGFEIVTDETSLTIYGQERGCMYGMFELLEQYVGFRYIEMNVTYIYEAEHIDIPAGLNHKEVPQFRHRSVYSDSQPNYSYKSDDGAIQATKRHMFSNDKVKFGGNCYGETMHGYSEYIPSVSWQFQPCLTDKYVLEDCIDNVLNDLYAREKTTPGFENEVNRLVRLGHNDNNKFCTCKECTKVFKEEGDYSGLNVRFCNEVSKAVDAEFDTDIYIGVFAYWGAVKPPKETKPLPHVTVTYCMYCMCWNHVLGEGECDPNNIGYDKLTNIRHYEYLKEWCDISESVIVYWYGLGHQDALSPQFFDDLYYDMQLMAQTDIDGIMSYGMYNNPALGKLADYLFAKLSWEPTMSKEKFQEIYEEAIYLFYGEGYEYIEQLIRLYAAAKDQTPCFSLTLETYTNYEYMGDNYDEIVRCIEKAISLCDTAEQQAELEEFGSVLYFAALTGAHEELYVNGTEAQREDYAEKYETLYKWLRERRYYPYDLPAPDVSKTPLEAIEIRNAMV